MNLAEQLRNRHEELFHKSRSEELAMLAKQAKFEEQADENIDQDVLEALRTHVAWLTKLPVSFSQDGQSAEWDFETPIRTTVGWTEGYHTRRIEALAKIAHEQGLKRVLVHSKPRASRSEEGYPLRFISKVTLWF
jgi:hypothetical protein